MNHVVITDHGFASIEQERGILASGGFQLATEPAPPQGAVSNQMRQAEALLVQWAKLDASMLAQLDRCKVIVRYGIGVDNIDLAAAKARGIAVCNVPDYGIDEVADHAVAMAVSLGRQLVQLDQRLRQGIWKLAPVAPMPAFREMVFATAGFGRIAKAALNRARGFKFQLAAYDPYVPESAFAEFGARRLELAELFQQADVLSLHLPLTEQTRHFVNATRLAQMKPTSIVINTARGPLVDAEALASALHRQVIGGAGLDVFDPEPLPADNPLRQSPNTLITSHVAWYSERSVPTLQVKAAEEVLRALRGQPLLHRVN